MTNQNPTINNPAADDLMRKLLREAYEKLELAEAHMKLKGWDKTHETLAEEILESKIAVAMAGMALDDTAK